MSKLKSISGFLSSNVAILIILFSIIAFFKPNGFSWATNYTAIFLGVAMFGMGLTIKTQVHKTKGIGFRFCITIYNYATFSLCIG